MEIRDDTKPLTAGAAERSKAGPDDETEPALAPAMSDPAPTGVVPQSSAPEQASADARRRRPWHRAVIAASAIVALGFLAGSVIAFSGGGEQTTEPPLRPEASIVSTAPTTAPSDSAPRATTTLPVVEAVAPPTVAVTAPTVETVPTTVAPSTTTPETTPPSP